MTLRDVFDLLGRVTGRPVAVDVQPAQKGDMRDTYADTTLARADLGFAPVGHARRGPDGDVSLVLDPMTGCTATARDGAGRRGPVAGGLRRASGPPCRRPTPRPTSSCSSAARRSSRSGSGSRRASTTARSSTTTRRATYRPDAKLGVGDTYIGEHNTESLLLAVNEFREFLTFYPTSPRADYAQYRLAFAQSRADAGTGARSDEHARSGQGTAGLRRSLSRTARCCPRPGRCMRKAKDRLSEASYRVGFFYYRVEVVSGRRRSLQAGAERGPGVHAAATPSTTTWPKSLLRQEKKAEALPYFERLLKEFEQSSYLEPQPPPGGRTQERAGR